MKDSARNLMVLGLVICLGCAGESDPTPSTGRVVAPSKTCAVTLSVEATGDASVVGEFNDWIAEDLSNNDGRQTLDLGELAPGEYAWALVRGGDQESAPPEDLETKWLDGQEFRKLSVDDCTLPSWSVAAPPTETDGEVSATFTFVRNAQKVALDPETLRVTVAGVALDAEAISVDEAGVSVTFPASAGKHSIRVYGSDTAGNAADNDGFWLPFWVEAQQFVWQDGVMYLVFTDRFRDSDGVRPENPAPGTLQEIASYMGGDFEGLRQAISEDYFTELGANVLWISPIYENPAGALDGRDENVYTGFHGYWPIDPLQAETAYGGDEALHAVVEAAHAKGIRVVFDVVLNHVHEDHTYCSENPTWCATTCVCGTDNCDWEGRALDCQFAPYLPDLNYRNHEIVERVLDDVVAMMVKFDVDGLRIDAAKHMDHVIMRTLRIRLNALEAAGAAPFYLVGETFTGDRGLINNYIADTELHGQFDFPLYYAIRGAFAGNGSLRDLEAATAESQRAYGNAYTWMSPFLGNHDIPRFATEAAGNDLGPFGNSIDLMDEGDGSTITAQWLIDRMSMAFAFVLTQPGVPLIYYGDEVGLAGGGDPDNRRMMPGSLNANRLELLRRMQALGQARKAIPALRGDGRKELWLDDSMYVYVRTAGAESAFVAMNKGDASRTETVTIPSALGLAGGRLKVWGQDERTVNVIDGTIQLTLEPWEYVILVPDEAN